MAFRFKDKERPRGYTSKVAGLLHVGFSNSQAFSLRGPFTIQLLNMLLFLLLLLLLLLVVVLMCVFHTTEKP